MRVGDSFQRDYLLRLPLPLAQLYSRAHNAKDNRSRHDHAYYLFESLLKLSVVPAMAHFLRGLSQGGRRDAKLEAAAQAIRCPSLGQWHAMLRALSRHIEEAGAGHPFHTLAAQAARRRTSDEAPALVALYNRILHGPDEQPGADTGCSMLQLFDRLVQYRNAVVGHGGPRFEAFYEQEMGPLIFPAVNEVLAEGFYEPLGMPGARLAYLTEMRLLGGGVVEVSYRELTGLQGQRAAPIRHPADQAASLAPRQGEFAGLALLPADDALPLRLAPLLRFRESEVADEVLFLNRDRAGRHVEYLSYTTGRVDKDAATVGEVEALLAATAAAPPPMGPGELPQLDQRDDRPRGRVVGENEILCEIGRGGMGEVYLARQVALGRLVALKLLPRTLAENPESLARFHREVRLLSECDHPNIIKLLSSGRDADGTWWYGMEYVPGADFDDIFLDMRKQKLDGTHLSAAALRAQHFDAALARATLDRHDALRGRWEKSQQAEARRAAGEELEFPLPAPGAARPARPEGGGLNLAREAAQAALAAGQAVGGVARDAVGVVADRFRRRSGMAADEAYVRRVVALVREAALALDTLHERGIVHRDIAPGNLMVASNGRLVLMDFGLAKAEGSLSRSRGGGFLGKIRYAAPEQLAASAMRVGPAADLRALGVVLWELLLRRRLFEEATDERQLATLVQTRDVPRLSQFEHGFDLDLEAIVARATERDQERRIGSAAVLAEYLRMWLDGEPLPIRPPTVGELTGRWVREHKAVLGVTAAAVLTLAVFGGLAVAQVFRERDIANKAKDDLGRVNQELKDSLEGVRKAKAEADQNLALSSNTIREMLRVVTTEFREQGLYGPQRAVLKGLVEQIEAYRTRRGDPSFLADELATANTTLCESALYLGELDEAVTLGQDAERLLQGLAPSDGLSLRQVQVAILLAKIRLARGEVDTGLRRAEPLPARIEKLLESDGHNPDYREAQVSALVTLARLYARSGTPESLAKAVGWIDSARAFLSGLDTTQDRRLANRVAELEIETAMLRTKLGQRELAMVAYGFAIDTLKGFQNELQATAPMRVNLSIALRERFRLTAAEEERAAALRNDGGGVDVEGVFYSNLYTRRAELAQSVSLVRSAVDSSSQVREYQAERVRSLLALAQLDLARVPARLDPVDRFAREREIRDSLDAAKDAIDLLAKSGGAAPFADLPALQAEYSRTLALYFGLFVVSE